MFESANIAILRITNFQNKSLHVDVKMSIFYCQTHGYPQVPSPETKAETYLPEMKSLHY